MKPKDTVNLNPPGFVSLNLSQEHITDPKIRPRSCLPSEPNIWSCDSEILRKHNLAAFPSILKFLWLTLTHRLCYSNVRLNCETEGSRSTPKVSALSIFLASLFGSAHCVAMCGGFVALYSTNNTYQQCSNTHNTGRDRFAAVLPQASYHLGRLITYVSLGTLAAYMGATVDKIGAIFYVDRVVVPLVGLLILFWGGSVLLGGQKILPLPKTGPYALGRLLASPMRVTMGLRGKYSGSKVVFPALLGLTTTLLPCGWLYGFLLIASTSASAPAAAVTMSLFWLGSIPALSLSTVICRALGQMANRYMPLITGILLIAAGFFSLYQHVSTSLPTGGCH